MGTRILGGRYRLVERLGHGGMSVVWLGFDEVLGREVAVKLLTARFAAHAPSADRIRIEAQAAARLSHPHVTAVHDYGESNTETGERVPYVVMELLTGRTLGARLKEAPLPVPAALLVCAQVASALAAAHAAGLVHRDVKPSNVMLTAAGVKVLDFGLAAPAGAAAESSLDGQVLGTPAYLAPERLIAGDVVPASDVYGLGLLLYASVTGGLPWRAETVTEMLSAHWYMEPAPLPPAVGLPRGVRALYQRCLAKDPRERPTAQEMATGLAEATVRRRHGRSWVAAAVSSTAPLPDAVPVAIRAPVPVPEGSVPASHNRWGAVALAGSAAVVVAALAGGLMVPADEGILPDSPVPGVAANEPGVPPSDPQAALTRLNDRDAAQAGIPGSPGPDVMIPVAATGAGGGPGGAGSGGVPPVVSDPAPDPAPDPNPDPDPSDPPPDPGPSDPGPSDPGPSDPPASPPAPDPSPVPSPDPPLDPPADETEPLEQTDQTGGAPATPLLTVSPVPQ